MPNVGDRTTKTITINFGEILKACGVAEITATTISAMSKAAAKIITKSAVASDGNPYVFAGITIVSIAGALATYAMGELLGDKSVFKLKLKLEYREVTLHHGDGDYIVEKWVCYDYSYTVS